MAYLFKFGHVQGNGVEALGEQELQLGSQAFLLQPYYSPTREWYEHQAWPAQDLTRLLRTTIIASKAPITLQKKSEGHELHACDRVWTKTIS